MEYFGVFGGRHGLLDPESGLHALRTLFFLFLFLLLSVLRLFQFTNQSLSNFAYRLATTTITSVRFSSCPN